MTGGSGPGRAGTAGCLIQPSRSTRRRQPGQPTTCCQARSSSSLESWPSTNADALAPRWPPRLRITGARDQQRTAGAHPAGRRGAVGERLAEHRAAAVDAGADRAHLDAEHVRDLLVGQPLDVAEDDRRAELRRERRERRLTSASKVWLRYAASGVGSLLGRRSPASSASESNRIRLLRRAWSRKRFVVIRCSQPSKVPGGVGVQRAEHPDEDLLGEVLGVVRVAGQAVGEAEDPRRVVGRRSAPSWARPAARSGRPVRWPSPTPVFACRA